MEFFKGKRPPTRIDKTSVPAMMIPSFRSSYAIGRGVERNLLMQTWGGLGDQICAEPTLRYAISTMKDCKISLASDNAEVFSHLKFDKIYDLNRTCPNYEDYFTFNTIYQNGHLQWEFMCHLLVHQVDHASLCAFRCQLPIKDREIVLKPPTPNNPLLHKLVDNKQNYVVIHAGKHWESKTFPVAWWNACIDSIIGSGFIPVLIGKEIDENQGTVDTKTAGCIDLRNKTTVNESIWLLQQMPILICNDSSPMHMAASGPAWIGFLATAKHHDLVAHWRRGQWSWRMENFSLGGMWELVDNCPNKKLEIVVDKCPESQLVKWLPDPNIFGPWCVEKMREYFKSI